MKNLSSKIYYLPLITPILLYISTELFLFWPKYFFWFLLVANLILIFTVYSFYKKSGSEESFFNFLILPWIFLNSISAYSAFINNVDNKWLVQILFFLNLVVQYNYLKFLFYYLIKTTSYSLGSIENISAFSGYLSFYFLSASVFGLQSFMNMSIWLTMLLSAPFFVLLINQYLWSAKFDQSQRYIFTLLASILVIEGLWAVSLLPFNFQVSGFVMSIFYFILLQIIKLQLSGKTDWRSARWYVFSGILILIAIMLTSQWVNY